MSAPRLSLLLLLSAVLSPAFAQDPQADPKDQPDLAEPAPPEAGIGPAPEGQGKPVPLEEIRRYVSVFRTVREAYVDEVKEPKLMQAAIRGLLTDLDPHSAYLDHEQTRSMDEMTEGAYDGIGLELVQQPDRSLLVIAPIDDTPADRAGLRSGDVIVAIDGEPIHAESVDAAVNDLRGPPGSEVRLTVLREGAEAPLELVVVRQTIRITSVRGKLLEPGFGYLRISTFQGDTGPQVGSRVQALAKDNAGPLSGLVLDLRSNPGGLLNAAVEAADAFLDSGVIVSTKGRMAFANAEYRARPGDVLGGAPMVVLVDAGTASAAEVLAGALRDRQRALVLGTRTFGKGSVQSILPLDNGDSIKLTTARYYTPSGRSIQASGIAPDIVLAEDYRRDRGERPPSLRERDLPGHLHGDHEEDGKPGAAEAEKESAPAEDHALTEALNVLKGLALLGQRPPAG